VTEIQTTFRRRFVTEIYSLVVIRVVSPPFKGTTGYRITVYLQTYLFKQQNIHMKAKHYTRCPSCVVFCFHMAFLLSSVAGCVKFRPNTHLVDVKIRRTSKTRQRNFVSLVLVYQYYRIMTAVVIVAAAGHLAQEKKEHRANMLVSVA